MRPDGWWYFHLKTLAALAIDVPSEAFEGAGVPADPGEVSVFQPPAADVTVYLDSDDSAEVTVPSSVVIPAGQTSAVFDLTVTDDGLIDGSQPVYIAAFADGYEADRDQIYIHDNELHQFRNTGAEPFDFICVVPQRGES